MSNFAFYALTFLIAFLFFYFWRRYNEIRKLPPGPWGLPVVGYLPWIDQNLYRMSKNASQKYGPIFSVQLGQYLVVFLHDIDIAKEAFLKNGDIFAGRPKLFWMVHTNQGRGIAASEGEAWKTIRRYTSSSLRDFGMGKLSLEGKIHEEIQHMFQRIDDQNGKPFRATQMMANAVCNVVCSVLFGSRFEYEDPMFKTLVAAATDGFGIGQAAVLNWLPWLSNFPPFNKQKDIYARLSVPFFANSNAAIKKAEMQLDADQKPSNFVEALMEEVRQGGSRAETLKDHCVFTINQLFLAANETTATAMDWGLLLLILNPDVQRKMQEEIDRVVGRDRLPSWDDRTRLPYVEAAMYEVLRMANIAAISLPHRCMEDTNLRGYFIPKDAVVFSSMGNWSMDKELFPDPLVFDPEKFLTAEGKVDYKKPMAPFGMGKRECVGEALAKMEMFNFLASLMQNYTLLPEPGKKLDYVEGPDRESAWTTHPAAYQLIAVRR